MTVRSAEIIGQFSKTTTGTKIPSVKTVNPQQQQQQQQQQLGFGIFVGFWWNTFMEGGGSEIGWYGSFGVVILAWGILLCKQRVREVDKKTERERKDKKKKERKDWKREPPSVRLRLPDPPFRGKTSGLCTESKISVVGFNAYCELKIKKESLEKEKKTQTLCTTCNQSPLSEEIQLAWALRARKLVVFAYYWGNCFCHFGFEQFFPCGNRVCGQYQGLSLIPRILLPFLTGTLELVQLYDFDWIPWLV